MYQVNLFYGYEENECGIFHAFSMKDVTENINGDKMARTLAEDLDLDPEDDRFHWNSMYVDLPASVVEKIKADAVREYIAAQKEK